MPLLSKPEEMNIFELQEMVKSDATRITDYGLADYVPKSIREPVGNPFLKVKSSIMGLYERAKKILTGEEEEQAKKGEEEHEPAEDAKAMNGAYKSFRIDGRGKTDINSYTVLKPMVKKVVEEQL